MDSHLRGNDMQPVSSAIYDYFYLKMPEFPSERYFHLPL